MARYDSMPGLRIVLWDDEHPLTPPPRDNIRSRLRAVRAWRKGDETLAVRWGGFERGEFRPMEQLIVRGRDLKLMIDWRWNLHSGPWLDSMSVDSITLGPKPRWDEDGHLVPPRPYDSVMYPDSMFIIRHPRGTFPLFRGV